MCIQNEIPRILARPSQNILSKDFPQMKSADKVKKYKVGVQFKNMYDVMHK